MDSILLAQLIYTRVSHDLSGAAGAVYNGTELLCEDLSFAAESAQLIQSSADNLMKRLRFFRQTFGLQNKQDADTTQEYLSTFSMLFTVNAPCQNNLQRCLIMTLTDVFYKGATFEVSDTYLKATGDAIKECENLADILQKGTISQSANDAPAIFAYVLADNLCKKLIFTKTDKSITINFKDK